MSSVERAISAFKDVLLFREQLSQMRVEITTLSGDVAELARDMRGFEQRLSKLEGYIEGATRAPFQPDGIPRIKGEL